MQTILPMPASGQPSRGLPLTGGQALGLRRPQALEPGGRERLRRDVPDYPREISQRSVRVDQPGLLGTGPAVPYELHGSPQWAARPGTDMTRWR